MFIVSLTPYKRSIDGSLRLQHGNSARDLKKSAARWQGPESAELPLEKRGTKCYLSLCLHVVLGPFGLPKCNAPYSRRGDCPLWLSGRPIFLSGWSSIAFEDPSSPARQQGSLVVSRTDAPPGPRRIPNRTVPTPPRLRRAPVLLQQMISSEWCSKRPQKILQETWLHNRFGKFITIWWCGS